MRKQLNAVGLIVCILFLYLPAAEGEDRGRAYYDFGVFAYEDGDYEDAENNLKKALEFNPNNPFYNHYMGKICLKTERYDDAMTYLMQAMKTDPSIPELKYDVAFLNYKLSDYAKAAAGFKAVSAADPSNVLAQYYAGISLYRLKNYKDSKDYFIQAGEKSPTLRANAYYHAAICYQQMGESDNALEKFEYVREHADSEEFRQSAVRWIQAVQEQKNRFKPYSLYLKIAHSYDDNVTLDSDVTDSDTAADEDDYLSVAYFSGKYNFISQREYQAGIGYSHYQSWYNNLDEYNLTGSIFSLYTKYRLHPFTLGFAYMPSYYWLDSESYLRRHRLEPELIWEISGNFLIRLSYSYDKDDYFQDSDMSGHTNEVFGDIFYSLSEGVLFFGGIGYKKNTASHSDYSYGQLKASLGMSLDLPWELNLRMAGKYQKRQYDDADSYYGLEREDSKYSADLSLSKKLFYDWLSIGAEFNYTKNDSNIREYEYDKKTVGLSVTARY
jgi:tetratricopeptide (TPR) repeat protein